MVETFTVRPQEFLQMPQNRALSRFCNDSSLLIGVVPLAVSRSQVNPAESVLRLQGAEGLLLRPWKASWTSCIHVEELQTSAGKCNIITCKILQTMICMPPVMFIVRIQSVIKSLSRHCSGPDVLSKTTD